MIKKNDKKVTAAEWLRKEIILNSKHKENSKGGTSFDIGLSKFDELFIQANKMEERQILDAWRDGANRNTGFGDGETYYDETFKNL